MQSGQTAARTGTARAGKRTSNTRRFMVATVLGLAFFWQYIRGSFIFSFFATDLVVSDAQLLYAATITVCALVLFAVPTMMGRLFCDRRAVCTGLLALSSVALALICLMPANKACLWTGAVFGGLSFALLAIAWGDCCARRIHRTEYRSLATCVALSFFISFAIAVPLQYTNIDAWFFSLCPLASGLLWHYASGVARDGNTCSADAASAAAVHGKDRDVIAAYAIIALVVSLSGVLAGLYGNVDSGYPGAGVRRFYESMAFSLVVLVLVYATSKRPVLNVLVWGFALLLVLVGTISSLMLQESFTIAGADILTVGRRTIWIILWLLIVSAPSRSVNEVRRDLALFFVAAFGVSRIIIDVMRLLHPLEIFPHDSMPLITLAIAALLIICAFIITGARMYDYFRSHSEALARERGELGSAQGNRSRIVHELAEAHQLTARECATFEQLALGHTMPHIAESLGVSASTVRSHAKAIYRKLNCHSKQDLIDMVDEQLGR